MQSNLQGNIHSSLQTSLQNTMANVTSIPVSSMGMGGAMMAAPSQLISAQHMLQQPI